MINVSELIQYFSSLNIDFFTGVPDSLLKELCLCIKDITPKDKNIIAANEGNAVALACGYNIASKKYGVVYMQNSGLGNSINPILSLADSKVYEIPMLLIISPVFPNSAVVVRRFAKWFAGIHFFSSSLTFILPLLCSDCAVPFNCSNVTSP